jgi:hypothetical protein
LYDLSLVKVELIGQDFELLGSSLGRRFLWPCELSVACAWIRPWRPIVKVSSNRMDFIDDYKIMGVRLPENQKV